MTDGSSNPVLTDARSTRDALGSNVARPKSEWDAIRAGFVRPNGTLGELFGRISFNILCGNTDDHGRNHAAFVGELPQLTPAYDSCP